MVSYTSHRSLSEHAGVTLTQASDEGSYVTSIGLRPANCLQVSASWLSNPWLRTKSKKLKRSHVVPKMNLERIKPREHSERNPLQRIVARFHYHNHNFISSPCSLQQQNLEMVNHVHFAFKPSGYLEHQVNFHPTEARQRAYFVQ